MQTTASRSSVEESLEFRHYLVCTCFIFLLCVNYSGYITCNDIRTIQEKAVVTCVSLRLRVSGESHETSCYLGFEWRVSRMRMARRIEGLLTAVCESVEGKSWVAKPRRRQPFRLVELLNEAT
jgi:hypothetical protein